MNATPIEIIRLAIFVPGLILYIWATMKVAARKDMRIQHLGPMIARSVVVFGMTFVAALAVIFDDFSTFWTNVSQLTYLMCGVIIIWLGYGYYFKKLRG